MDKFRNELRIAGVPLNQFKPPNGETVTDVRIDADLTNVQNEYNTRQNERTVMLLPFKIKCHLLMNVSSTLHLAYVIRCGNELFRLWTTYLLL